MTYRVHVVLTDGRSREPVVEAETRAFAAQRASQLEFGRADRRAPAARVARVVSVDPYDEPGAPR